MNQLIRPPFHPESLEYTEAVVQTAASALEQSVDAGAEMIASLANSDVSFEIKTDARGETSPVTKYDTATERLIGGFFDGTNVRIMGEEATTSWPEDQIPNFDLHVDPIDGTDLFIKYFRALVAWKRSLRELPASKDNLATETEEIMHQDTILARPFCGSMISAGASQPGNNTPEWGSIAAPFLSPEGIVRWSVGPRTPAVRIDPDNSRHELPHALELRAPKEGGAVLVASTTAQKILQEPLESAGFRVLKYRSAVAATLSTMDPGLFEHLRPTELGNDPIVGVVMRSAKNWDVAATIAIANQLGHFVSDTHGAPRTFENKSTGTIFATREVIGRKLVEVIAPHLDQ